MIATPGEARIIRLLAPSCCLVAACIALSAPVPKGKESAFQRPGWSKPIDPDEKCKFVFTKEDVTIEAPAGHMDFHPGGPTKRFPKLRTNAPRLMQSVKGDFDVEVRVQGELKVTLARGSGEVTAGLLVTDTEGKSAAFRMVWGMHNLGKGRTRLLAYVRMGAKQMELTTKRWEIDPTVKAIVANGGLKKGAFVKIERRGSKLKGYFSADGNKWALLPRVAGDEDHDTIEGDVKVGVALFTRSDETNTVTFDRFKLTPVKPK